MGAAAEYMALPASQYSVLDAERIERIDDDTFRCYVGGLRLFSLVVKPVLTVSVVVGERGPTVKLLDTQVPPARARCHRRLSLSHALIVIYSIRFPMLSRSRAHAPATVHTKQAPGRQHVLNLQAGRICESHVEDRRIDYFRGRCHR